MKVTRPASSVAMTPSPMLVSVVCNKSRLAVVRVVGSLQIDNQAVALGSGAADIESGQQQKHK